MVNNSYPHSSNTDQIIGVDANTCTGCMHVIIDIIVYVYIRRLNRQRSFNFENNHPVGCCQSETQSSITSKGKPTFTPNTLPLKG